MFVDEIHRLNRQVEEVLYPAMEDFAIDIMIGKGSAARSIRLNLPKFTLVGATTRAGMLTAPLRDRFGVMHRLELYTPEELKTIILRSASVLNVEIEEDGALELARRSTGTPRLANRLLKRVRDFAQVKYDGKITKKVADYALDLLDVDKYGLDHIDRTILLTMIEKFQGGPVGLDTLAAAISEDAGTLEDVYGYFDSDSSVERTVKPAKNGNTVVSTIDVTLQNIVEKCILEFNSAHAADGNPGSKNTAVIIMNPNTGEILAEASYPNFDLNDPRNLSLLYTKEQWDAMSEEDQVEAMNDLWRNFCVSDAYEPGSTAKPFTVAAGLETGTLTGNESYYCGGSKDVLGTKISCHYKSGHGQETIQDAIANSCNVALMDMAAVIGPENFTKYQHIFGFGEYTGIDLPGEAETSGLLYTADTMGEIDLATNSFGQNFNVTMTQMVSAFSSLVNGGYYYEPHVVKQIQDEDGNVIETKDPVLLRKTVSSETSKMLRQYLKATMDYGTGTRAKVEGYDIGAKTGTAEKLPRGNGKYLLSYIGYAPQNNPEVVVYVVIDEPYTAVQDDSSLVLGLSQKIMSEAFPYLGITTIAQSGQNAQAQGQNFGNTEYTDYDENYEDTYGNADGSYVDENYTPDLDDWASSDVSE